MDIKGCDKEVLDNAGEWIDKVTIIAIELHDGICMGCAGSFYLATRDFARFERRGEIVIAYRI